MSERVRVSAVSYLNTAPFVFGLMHHPIKAKIDLVLDYPSECARKVIAGESDLGLVPLASIIHRNNLQIVGDYCIGANGRVRTVALLSNSPLDSIDTIFLDYQSLTSITLVKVLAKNLWNRQIQWKPFGPNDTHLNLLPNEGIVAIGDKVFSMEPHFENSIDLAHEWEKLTGLPMVFAVWVANRQIDEAFLEEFNLALKFGVHRIPSAITFFGNSIISKAEAEVYLTENISYPVDNRKREAIVTFTSLSSELLP